MTRHTSALRPTVAVGLLALFVATATPAAEPRPSPSRYVPAEGLIALLEYDGLDAHRAAWEATAARGLLRDTPAGALLTDLATQALDRALKDGSGLKLRGADLVALHDHVARHGLAMAVNETPAKTAATVLFVFNGLGRGEPRRLVERAIATSMFNPLGQAPQPTTIEGRPVFMVGSGGEDNTFQDRSKVTPPAPAVAVPAGVPVAVPAPTLPAAPPGLFNLPHEPWFSVWFEGDDVCLVVGRGDEVAPPPAPESGKKPSPRTHAGVVAHVIATIAGRRPNAVSHPGRLAALAEGGDLAGFEASGLLVVEPGKDGRRLLEGLANSFATEVAPPAPIPDMVVPAPPTVPGVAPAPFPVPGPATPPPAVPPGVLVDGVVVAEPAPIARFVGPDPRPAMTEPSNKLDGPDWTKRLGLDGVRRVVVRWGFQGKALVTATRIEAPRPHKGVLDLLDPKPFKKDALPPIPSGARSVVIAAFEPAKGYAKLVELCKQIEPAAAKDIDRFEQVVRATTGQRLREDLLGHLGPAWTLVNFASPTPKDPNNTRPAIPAGVDDPDAFARVLDGLAERLNAHFREPSKPGEGPVAPVLALERLEPPARGYKLTSPSNLVLWLGPFEPTVQVGRSVVAFAFHPAHANAALAADLGAEGRWSPAGEVAEALRGLPDELTLLAVGDPRDSSWPAGLAVLPDRAQLFAASATSMDVTGTGGPIPTLVLDRLAIPHPGSFRFRLDPARMPKAADVERLLFPSVLAAVADDRGYRLVSREALPLACLPLHLKLSTTWKWKGPDGPRFEDTSRIELRK